MSAVASEMETEWCLVQLLLLSVTTLAGESDDPAGNQLVSFRDKTMVSLLSLSFFLAINVPLLGKGFPTILPSALFKHHGGLVQVILPPFNFVHNILISILTIHSSFTRCLAL